MQKLKFRLRKDLLNVMVQTIAIFIFQASLCGFIMNETEFSKLQSGDTLGVPSLDLGLARFITGIAMHVKMTNKIGHGMDKMKFALNHKWKFSRWRYGYLLAEVERRIPQAIDGAEEADQGIRGHPRDATGRHRCKADAVSYANPTFALRVARR